MLLAVGASRTTAVQAKFNLLPLPLGTESLSRGAVPGVSDAFFPMSR